MVAEQRLRSGFIVNHRATPPDFFKKNVYKFKCVFLLFAVAIMSTHRDETHGIPEFSGDVAAYRDWKRPVQIKHAGAKDEVRALTAVRALGALRGEAWLATRHFDRALAYP